MMAAKRSSSKRAAASAQQPQLKARGQSYLDHHREMASVSLKRLLVSPMATLMTLAVLAIALSLPSVLYVGLQNADQLSDHWRGSSQLSVFLELTLGDDEGRDLAEQLKANSQVADLTYLSRDQALEEFKTYAGFGRALEQLQSNPLPAVILITPTDHYLASNSLSEFSQQLLSLDGVDDVRVDMAWVERLQAMIDLAQRMVLLLGSLLAAGALLVVGNTIRLEILNRRDEILVVKLVGGTDSFVRRPFLYTGFWYGLGAGLLASVLVQISSWYLSSVVARLILLYQSDFQLQTLNIASSISLILFAVLLGISGAWLAVLKHLKAIEPR